MILALSRFRVKNAMESEVRTAFAQRPRLVDDVPGFLGMETFTDSKDPSVFLLATRWVDVDSYRSWHSSEAHRRSHVGIPRGLKLDPAFTELLILDRLEDPVGETSLEVLVNDAPSLIATFLTRTRTLHLFAGSLDGTLTRCNEVAADGLGVPAVEVLGQPIWRFLVEPDQVTLRARLGSGRRRHGDLRLNFVGPSQRPYTLECVLEIGDGFTLLGESTVPHWGETEEALIQLNSELSVLARENARLKLGLQKAHDKFRQMAFEAVVTEERERRRIAADLHDTVGQTLALSQIKLTHLRQEIRGAPRKAIDQVIALIEQSIASAQTLTFELSPPILYDLGLNEALCWLAEKLEETYETRIEIADDETDKPLDAITAGLVFRATRELLLNVVRHSRAPTAKVSLRRVGDRLAVSVEDTGVGFDPDDQTVRSGGYGLLSVREQIGRLQGSMEVSSSPGQGARVAISVPISTTDGKAADAARSFQN